MPANIERKREMNRKCKWIKIGNEQYAVGEDSVQEINYNEKKRLAEIRYNDKSALGIYVYQNERVEVEYVL